MLMRVPPTLLVALCGLAYGIVHSVLRLSLSDVIPIDDVWENIFAQEFRLQYTPRNPPLYTWILFGVQKITGPTLLSFLLLKYTLWTLTAIFLFKAILLVTHSVKHGYIGAASLLLLYQVGWNAHEGVTQTALLSTTIAASLWAWSYTLLERRGFHWLLMCAVVGVLAKYSYLAFIGCALVSCLIVQRTLLRQWQFWAMFVLPFALFLAGYFTLIWAGKTGTQTALEIDVITGFVKVAPAWISFLFPLLFVLLFLDYRFVRRASRTMPEAWAGWFIAIAFVVCLTIGSLSPESIRERYMHVFLLPFLLWATPRITLTSATLRNFIGVTLASILVVLGVRFVNLADGTKATCGKKCRNLIPYSALYKPLQPYAHGTIISTDRYTAGNLRALFPDATILWIPSFATKLSPPCVQVEPADVTDYDVQGNWNSLLQSEGYRKSYWSLEADPVCTLEKKSMQPSTNQENAPFILRERTAL